ncbi:MAG: bacterial regulatory helix-turn-helix, lysR family protein [Rhizobium sp.]|nr:bacterial regulatory helix-turn-helix, lysR family protein [Rhizobium sp.]
MKRGRLPLTALRSFEVAGRLLSFTRAAEELFVSQAAISRQIRELEASIGRPLFERRHRAVVLTDDGASFLATLTEAFDRIDASLSTLAEGTLSQTVTISVEPSFAALWMVPNLAEFRMQHPDIDVRIESDPRLVEFRTNEAVLAVRHGSFGGDWPRTEARHLSEVEMVPVVAPSLLATGTPLDHPEDIQQFELLHEENRRVWADWFKAAGAPEDSWDRGPVLADGYLVMQAALRGHGAALCDRLFAEEEIAASRLVQPFDIRLPFGAYYLVARNFKALPGPADALANWLLSRFQEPAPEKTILAAVQQQ